MEAAKSKNMGSSDAAIEFAEGMVNTGTVAEGHGADESKGFAFEVLGIEAHYAAAQGEHTFGKGERRSGTEVTPVGHEAEALARNTLMTQMAGVVHFARISRIARKGEPRVKSDEVADLRSPDRCGGGRGGRGRGRGGRLGGCGIEDSSKLDEPAAIGETEHHTHHLPRLSGRLGDDALTGHGFRTPLWRLHKGAIRHKVIPYCDDCNKEKQERQ